MSSQAASSATNFLVGVAAARTGTVEEFGVFGLAFGAYLFVSALLRSYIVESAVVDFNRSKEASLPDTGAVLGAGLVGGVSAGLAILIGLGLIDVRVSALTLAAIAGSVSMCIAQETLRSFCIGSGRAIVSLLSDSVWLVIQVAVVALVLRSDVSFESALLGWGLGASFGVLVAGAASSASPSIVRGVGLLRDSRRIGASWVLDTALANSTGLIVPWLLVLIASTSEVAALRGALVLLGPSAVLFAGLRLAFLPAMAAAPPLTVWRYSIRLGLLFAVVAVGAGSVVILLPSSIGFRLLGASWSAVDEVLLYAVLWRVFASIATPPLLGLRSILETRSIVVVRLFSSFAALSGSAVGASIGGAKGALIGLAVSSLVAVPLWYASLRSAIERRSGALVRSQHDRRMGAAGDQRSSGF